MKKKNYLEKYSISRYIFGVTETKILVPLIVLLALTSSCLEMRTAYFECKIGLESENLHQLAFYISEKLLAVTCALGSALLSNILIASSFRKAIKIYFLEYVELRFQEFNNIGVGTIQSAINRRSGALIKFLNIVAIRFLVSITFLFVILYNISLYISIFTIYRMLLIIGCFMGSVVWIQSKRATLRKFINRSEEDNATKILDVLINHERIISFGNVDLELKKYRKILFEQHKNCQVYECSYNIIKYVIDIGLILMTCVLFGAVNNSKNTSSMHFKILIFIAAKLRGTVSSILADSNKVYTSFYNFSKSSVKRSQYDFSNRRFTLKKFNDRIDVINLTFSFGSKKILERINCKINKYDRIAICGPNSSGKSTFVRLLMGLYDYKGAILIDGIELKQLKEESLLRRIGYVSQDSTLFDTSIFNNLKLGNLNSSRDEIVAKCMDFNYHETFSMLGYDKICGQLGNKLSGGQRQRVNLMRSIIKNGDILIFDEAAAGLDSNSELEMIENVQKHISHSTVISIVRNVNAFNYFDKIFFVNSGKVATGTFKELYNTNAEFREFYECTHSSQ